MRTTLTIRDDLALVLKRLRRERNRSFKEIVNEALARGVDQMERKPESREPFQTRAVDLGPLLYPSVKEGHQAMDDAHDRRTLGPR